MSKKLKFLVLTLSLVLQPVLVNHAVADRIKDLTSVAGARSNQLIGYGLVVGLQGTGDEDKISFTAQSLKKVLERLGVDVDGRRPRARRTDAARQGRGGRRAALAD